MKRTTMIATGCWAMWALATPAMAGDFSLGLSLGGGQHGGHMGLTIQKGELQPRHRAPAERIWVPAVYRDVLERIWVPTAETRYRDVPVYDTAGQVIAYHREPYTLKTGHWEQVTRRELVRAGHWRTTDYRQPSRKYAHYDRSEHGRHAQMERLAHLATRTILRAMDRR